MGEKIRANQLHDKDTHKHTHTVGAHIHTHTSTHRLEQV